MRISLRQLSSFYFFDILHHSGFTFLKRGYKHHLMVDSFLEMLINTMWLLPPPQKNALHKVYSYSVPLYYKYFSQDLIKPQVYTNFQSKPATTLGKVLPLILGWLPKWKVVARLSCHLADYELFSFSQVHGLVITIQTEIFLNEFDHLTSACW